MYHPSHRVPDLPEAVAFFEKVFGRQSVSLAAAQKAKSYSTRDGYPDDYCYFTYIQDVWFDSIAPAKYIVDGKQIYPSVSRPELSGFGWGVQGAEEIYRELRSRGIGCTDQKNIVWRGEGAPRASFADTVLFWTLEQDTGLRYEIYPTASIGAADPRGAPGWRLPPVSASDPLGIERCSHHTVLTDNPGRALTLVKDVLGGVIIHEGRNPILETDSTYVALGDGVLEYAVPLPGSRYHSTWQERAPLDTYFSLTWLVQDLERAASHLESAGVRIAQRTRECVVADPDTALGIPWGFTTSCVPGDPRKA